jgi:hypothetical protein
VAIYAGRASDGAGAAQLDIQGVRVSVAVAGKARFASVKGAFDLGDCG